VSLAVGEHVPNPLEQSFVRNIHVHNCRGIVLCWGYLKEWGRGHVNNHGNVYIEKLFQELGYVFDAEASRQLRQRHARTNHESERKRFEHVFAKREIKALKIKCDDFMTCFLGSTFSTKSSMLSPILHTAMGPVSSMPSSVV